MQTAMLIEGPDPPEKSAAYTHSQRVVAAHADGVCFCRPPLVPDETNFATIVFR